MPAARRPRDVARGDDWKKVTISLATKSLMSSPNDFVDQFKKFTRGHKLPGAKQLSVSTYRQFTSSLLEAMIVAEVMHQMPYNVQSLWAVVSNRNFASALGFLEGRVMVHDVIRQRLGYSTF
ncbi:hypothetical protein ILUMI_05096 [Ignelater luminosus]|uniref:Uncharacterized protein n=1 Tax=Ignelater luminosus TaxID=2038154 RepID=A0A8K0D8D8_IGNLU|nr:hypothetical protein ILUMI_05096 [Ignelater luminosus]